MADHPRSHTESVLIRLLDGEEAFIRAAVDATNAAAERMAAPLSRSAFVRVGAIEKAEQVLGRKFAPPSKTARKKGPRK
jgi:hypothetical protein